MKNRSILLLLVVTMFSIASYSQDVTEQLAKVVAKKFMKKTGNSKYKVDSVIVEEYDGSTSYYVVTFEEGGWVMVSATEKVIPILAYSENGVFSTNNDRPEAISMLLNDYKQQINVARNDTIQKKQNIVDRWEELKSDSLIVRLKASTFVDHILKKFDDETRTNQTVRWAQSKNEDGGCNPAYNQAIDDGSTCSEECNKALAGCGAVAMAQIMWYWEWPKTYDWDRMPYELNEGDTESGEHIAGLIADCGEVLDMHYTCTFGGWTEPTEITDGFNAMGYNSVIRRKRSDWTSGDWVDLIKTEILLGRPVFYYGSDCALCSSKHYFIIDGYRPIGDLSYFKINWGWGTNDPGNFILDDLVQYHWNQSAWVGITPSYQILADNGGCTGSVEYGERKFVTVNNTITAPNTGTYTVKTGGFLKAVVGDEISFQQGFTAEAGSEVIAELSETIGADNCQISVTDYTNGIIKGEPVNGYFYIEAENVNSYDIYVYTASGTGLVDTRAGMMQSGTMTPVWDADNVSPGTYLASVVLRNNCGVPYLFQQYITVLSGSTVSPKDDDDLLYEKKKDLNDANTDSVQFTISPNPSSGIFTITTGNKGIPYSVEISNVNGKVIGIYKAITNTNYQINLSSLSKGTYILKIYTEKKIIVIKKLILTSYED